MIDTILYSMYRSGIFLVFLRDFVGWLEPSKTSKSKAQAILKGGRSTLECRPAPQSCVGARGWHGGWVVDGWWAMKIEGVEEIKINTLRKISIFTISCYFFGKEKFHLIDGIRYRRKLWQARNGHDFFKCLFQRQKDIFLASFFMKSRPTFFIARRRLANSFWQVGSWPT